MPQTDTPTPQETRPKQTLGQLADRILAEHAERIASRPTPAGMRGRIAEIVAAYAFNTHGDHTHTAEDTADKILTLLSAAPPRESEKPEVCVFCAKHLSGPPVLYTTCPDGCAAAPPEQERET